MTKARKQSRGDPLAKRRDENDLQWRSRVARTQETDRKAGEGIVTPEALAHGGLEDAYSPDGSNVRTYRRRATSSLIRLADRCVLDKDELAAAQEIALIAERIGSAVGVRVGALAARVDCEGSGRDYVAESLGRVRAERSYSVWRLSIPQPRGMVLDMVTEDHNLASIAARHGRNWARAVKVLKQSLAMWEQCKRDAWERIGQDDVDAAEKRCS